MRIRTALLAAAITLLATVSVLAQPSYDQSPFAINGLGLMFGKAHPNWEGWAKEAAAIKDAGIYWTRMDFWWGTIEPKQGEFDWSFTDRMAQFYREQKINAMPILCYSSAWYKKPPDNDEERARFANYVYQVVNRYKGTYKVWEVWNEPNIPSFWKPPKVRDYTLMLIEAYKAAKKADPSCTILAGATNGPDLTFIKGIHDNGGWDYCDGISIHPYSMAGGAVGMRLDKILRIINGYIESTGKHKSLWTTEMGWTADNPAQEKNEAVNMFESYVISMANGMDKLFFFCFSDWSEKWGIVKSVDPLVPKQAYKTYKLMTQRFGSPGPAAPFEGYLKMPDNVICYSFKKQGNERLLVLWSLDDNTHAVKLRQENGLSGVDIFGAPVTIGGGWLGVGRVPIMITGADAREIGEVSAAYNPFIEPKGINLIDNPSIEGKIGECPPGWHWGRFHHRDKNASYNTTQEGRNGSLCVSISQSGNNAAYDNRLIPVFPGAKYKMTGWIRTKDATGLNALSLKWYAGDQWQPLGDAHTQTITGTQDWTKVSVEGTVPDNACFLRPNLISENNSGTVWFDDIEVVEE